MRTKKLVAASLQFRLSLWFVAATAGALLFQYLLVSRELASLAQRLPGDPARHHAELAAAAWSTLQTSVLVVLPLIVGVGVLATFRLAGPLFSMQSFLERLVRGERPADCQLRKGDELQDFCALLNQATLPLRTAAEDEQGPHPLRKAA